MVASLDFQHHDHSKESVPDIRRMLIFKHFELESAPIHVIRMARHF